MIYGPWPPRWAPEGREVSHKAVVIDRFHCIAIIILFIFNFYNIVVVPLLFENRYIIYPMQSHNLNVTQNIILFNIYSLKETWCLF